MLSPFVVLRAGINTLELETKSWRHYTLFCIELTIKYRVKNNKLVENSGKNEKLSIIRKLRAMSLHKTLIISHSHYILRCCHRLPSTCPFHEALWAAISLLGRVEIENGRHAGTQAIDHQTTTARNLLELWKLGRNTSKKRYGSTC